MVSRNLFNYIVVVITIIAFSLSFPVEGRLASISKKFFKTSSPIAGGVKWAVLVAGSNEYSNYRHQADVCHAYQIMKKNGLKDENIIVFMYDDIAYNKENPRKGVIINNPHGKNVYPGVPKDYTRNAVNARNFYGVLLGNKTAVKGGSGKVLKSGPKDQVFIYYVDHGSTGELGMPNDEDSIYANDFIRVLKKMHASRAYDKMVIYIEACESGSMFEGLLPINLNIFATTASNKDESSYATYCGDDVPVPKEYDGTCLGDVYSVSWMEDSDAHDPRKETLHQQYVTVKNRTGNSGSESSHVMQYGEVGLSKDYLSFYWVPFSAKAQFVRPINFAHLQSNANHPLLTVDQRDTDLFYFQQKVKRLGRESNERSDAEKQLEEIIRHRKHVDQSVEAIVKALFGHVRGPSLLNASRPAGLPVVDDWDCLKNMAKTYVRFCGSLKTYGKKYMKGFANMCNAGVKEDKMAQVSAQVCASKS